MCTGPVLAQKPPAGYPGGPVTIIVALKAVCLGVFVQAFKARISA
jgi:hypothetical protein